jgi:hypothetical protein
MVTVENFAIYVRLFLKNIEQVQVKLVSKAI